MGIFKQPLDDGEAPKPKPYDAPRPITAAAARVTIGDKAEVERIKKRRQTDTWQTDAWEYYDLIGEVKYAFNLIGNVMSRIRLYPALITGDNVIPSPVDDVEGLPEGFAAAAHASLRKLNTANGGIPGLMKDLSTNLQVAGECYLVQQPKNPLTGATESWKIKSVDELVAVGGRGSGYGIKSRRTAKGTDIEAIPKGAFIARIWHMHARYSDEADSSLRGLLDLMDELLLLARSARATARSRLNAGAIFVPDGLSVAAQSDGESAASVDSEDEMAPFTDDDTDTFEEELLDAMTTPIQDESSAAAVVPLVIRGPAELADSIKVIKFERAWDPQLAARAEKVLDRILNGLDIPKDVVTGVANVKYSNAVQIEESLYKQHVEPLALMVCDALSVVFYRPYLLGLGYDPELVDRATLWYDPSSVNTKPDKATAATTGYDKKTISGDAWRRAHGFADTDAPPPLELAQRVALERGQLSEPITEALFKSLIPDLMEQIRQQQLASSPTGGQSPELQQALGVGGADQAPDTNLEAGDIPHPGQTPSAPAGGAQSSPTGGNPAPVPAGAPGGLLEP